MWWGLHGLCEGEKYEREGIVENNGVGLSAGNFSNYGIFIQLVAKRDITWLREIFSNYQDFYNSLFFDVVVCNVQVNKTTTSKNSSIEEAVYNINNCENNEINV